MPTFLNRTGLLIALLFAQGAIASTSSADEIRAFYAAYLPTLSQPASQSRPDLPFSRKFQRIIRHNAQACQAYSTGACGLKASGAAPHAWLQTYAGQSTNQLILDQRARPLIARLIPRDQIDVVFAGLHGPPDPVRLHNQRFLSMSACMAHACPVKAMLWVDLATGAGLVALWGVEPDQLQLMSTRIAAKSIPPEAVTAVVNWLTDKRLFPQSVSFRQTAHEQVLPDAANFWPHRAFIAPDTGPSFDCQQSSGALESVICRSPVLALADLHLATLLDELRQGHATEAAQANLQAFHTTWLLHRNSRCAAAQDIQDCLIAEYRAQDQVLRSWLPHSSQT